MLTAWLYILIGSGTTALGLLIFRRTRLLGFCLSTITIVLAIGTLLTFKEMRGYGILFSSLVLLSIIVLSGEQRTSKPKQKRKRKMNGVTTRFYDEENHQAERQTQVHHSTLSLKQPRSPRKTVRGDDFWSKYTPKGVTYNPETDTYTLSQSLMLNEGQFVLPEERQHTPDEADGSKQ